MISQGCAHARAHIGDVIEPAALQRDLSLIFQQYKVSRGINDHTTMNPRYIDLSSTIVK